MKKFLPLFLAMAVAFSCAKEKDSDNQGEKGPTLEPVVTAGTSQISAVSVVLMGKANLSLTVAPDLKIGFQYSKYAGILPGNSTTVEALNADKDYNFSTVITNLEPATTYYFRSFVRQNGQDTYGETKEFRTKDLSSLIYTQEATSVSAVSVRLNASIDLKDVNYSSKLFGFSWGTSQASLTNTVNATGEDDTIYADLSGLSPSVTYYFQSYVTLDGKKIKNNVVSFTTRDLSSLLYTHEASNIESTSVTLNAMLDLTDVKYRNIKYGFYWGTSETSQTTYLNGGEVTDNIYSASLSGLRPVVQYWYKSYVKLDNQVLYGEVKTFTTDVIHVQSVSLDKEEYSFNNIGDVLTLSATVLPGDATDKSITWSSDNEDIASVDSNGKVTARGNGTATISVTTTDQGKTASCAITVTQLVTSITFDNPSIALNEGESQTLTVTIAPYSAKDKTLTWTSSNDDVATVDNTGKVTAVSKGTAIITATANDGSGKFASCSVTVKRLVSSITLDKTSLAIYVGKTETLTATVSPSTANNTSVTWTSSGPSIATVSSAGLVTGKSSGKATITVTANDGSGKKAICTVSVIPDGAVDMGLSVFWASCNLCETGFVSQPAQYGDYYAWGELEPHYAQGHSQDNPCSDWRVIDGKTMTGYNWESYKWCNGSKTTLTRYNNDISYGTVDAMTTFSNYDYADDAARAKLGEKWRIPTRNEWMELYTQCTCTWTTRNGIYGMLVTATNSNSIFLPTAGEWRMTTYNDYGLYDAGAKGYYWSSTQSTSSPYCAAGVYFHSTDAPPYISVSTSHTTTRCTGLSVRPVTE